ncbi:MAG: hypothetical protein LBE34_13635 [Flavobacteriaceae bacterium]|jgi:hypothetical protein|nr:hypothetical protein [Flavobacteriaceae bacterium]
MLFDYYTFLAIDKSTDLTVIKQKIKQLTIKTLIENEHTDEIFESLKKLKEADIIFSKKSHKVFYDKVSKKCTLHNEVTSSIKLPVSAKTNLRSREHELFFHQVEIVAEEKVRTLLKKISDEKQFVNKAVVKQRRINRLRSMFYPATFTISTLYFLLSKVFVK